MFHPGKVLKVFRNDEKTVFGFDSSVLAMVLMWDDNLLTAKAEQGLEARLKEGDVVLLDYSPHNANVPVPKQMIAKVLRGEIGKTVWKEYEERFKRRKIDSEGPLPLSSQNIR